VHCCIFVASVIGVPHTRYSAYIFFFPCGELAAMQEIAAYVGGEDEIAVSCAVGWQQRLMILNRSTQKIVNAPQR